MRCRNTQHGAQQSKLYWRDICPLLNRLFQVQMRSNCLQEIRPFLGAKYYTPEIITGKFHWKLPLNIHWTFPAHFHWASDNPLENATEQWTYAWKCNWTSIGNCQWQSTTNSEVLISGVQLFVPLCVLQMFVLKIPWSRFRLTMPFLYLRLWTQDWYSHFRTSDALCCPKKRYGETEDE